MKTHFQLIYIMMLVFLPVFAHGQKFRLNVNFAPALPIGNFKDVTDGMTWRSWEVNLFYQATSKLSIGLGGGSESFYKRYPQTTFHEAGRDLTAVVTNSIELTPVMVKVRYDLCARSIHPYIGIGAGINLIHYDKYYGEFVDYDHEIKFAAQPEIGLMIPFSSTGKVGLNLGTGYNYMPLKNGEVNGLNNVVFKAGLDIKLD